MSGFGAIIEWGSVPDPERVRSLETGLAHRGPDGVRTVYLGECVLVNTQFATTPEALREQQPMRHLSQPWWITADARVDNREELATLLHGSTHPLDTDVDFLLAAYERWGEDMASRIRGDFAFAIWNEEKRQLFTARDHFGIRPFHWTDSVPGRFVAASSLRPVLEASGASRHPDLEYLAEYATFRFAGRGHSPYGSVRRLTPASTLVVSEGSSPQIHQYWSPRPATARVSLDGAAHALRTAFDEAVRARSRVVGTLGVQVSGGYDSSTVFVTADAQRAGKDLLGYTFAFPGEECDESRFVDDVARAATAPIERIVAADCPAFEHAEYVRRTWDLPLFPDSQWNVAGAQRMATQDCRVVLTGQGGDHVLFGDRELAAVDLLLSARIRRSIHVERQWSRRPMRSLAARSTRLLIRQQGRLHPNGATARAMRRRSERRALAIPTWPLLSQDLTSNCLPTFGPLSLAPRPWRRSAGSRASYLDGADRLTFFTELWDSTAAEAGVEFRHPFLDVAVVELALTLGEDLLLAHGSVRGLHAYAFADRLPASIRLRRDKAFFDRPGAAAFLSLADTAVLDPSAAGWVDIPATTRALNATTEWLRGTTTEDMPTTFWVVWGALSLWLWQTEIQP